VRSSHGAGRGWPPGLRSDCRGCAWRAISADPNDFNRRTAYWRERIERIEVKADPLLGGVGREAYSEARLRERQADGEVTRELIRCQRHKNQRALSNRHPFHSGAALISLFLV
jgi:hypothetical protein